MKKNSILCAFLAFLFVPFFQLKQADAQIANRTLRYGDVSEDVRILQQTLNQLGQNTTNRGEETVRFGEKTLYSIQSLQCKHDIVCAGSPGYGIFGPRTRDLLLSLLSKKTAQSATTGRVLGATTDGLVLYYAFDGNADDRAGTNNGTINGAVFTDGKIGQAMQFDGINDYVAAASDVSAGSAFSMSFWMKTSASGGYPIGWGGRSAKIVQTNKLMFYVDGGSSGGATTALNISDADWHHISIVSSSNSQTIYVDGSVSGTATEILNTAAAQLNIGRHPGAGYVGVAIDDFRLYNRALNSSEIQDIYADTAGGGVAPAPIPAPMPAPAPAPAPAPDDPKPVVGLSSYYVSTTGSDSNAGTESSPLRTIQRAANLARAGSTVYVQPGTYPEHVTTASAGTSDSARIKFIASGNVQMRGFTINHPYVNVEGFTIKKHTGTYAAHMRLNSTNCIVRNNSIKDGIGMITDQTINFSGNTLTVPGGGLIAAGFEPGVIVIATGTAANGGQWVVSSVTDTTMTFAAGRSVVPGPSVGRFIMSMPVQGIIFGNDSNSCSVSGNTIGNLYSHAITLSGDSHVVENNTIASMNGFDIFRLFGRGTIVRGNFIGNTVAVRGIGNHSDVFQTFYVPAQNNYLQDMVIEKNFIANMDGYQLGILEMDNTPLPSRLRGLTFRNNVFVNIELFLEILMPEVHFYNNTFYKSNVVGYGGHPILYNYVAGSGYVERSDGGSVTGNVFLESGLSGPDNGFYFTDSRVTPGAIGYNYVAGSPAAGYIGKSTSKFKEGAIGINGGDPGLNSISLSQILGGDGIPFTTDDGLKPRPGSILCGKGPGGTDIGAYSCDSSRVFADGSIGGSMPPPAPAPMPAPVSAPSLVLHLDFENDWTSNKVSLDRSGLGNNAACQHAFYPNNNSTNPLINANQCPTPVSGTESGRAAEFTGSICRLDSKYFSVPKANSLTNLDRGTISVWVNYNPATDPDFSIPPTNHRFQKILDTYHSGTPRSWSLGKNFAPNTDFIANGGSDEVLLMRFPDSGITGSWHLYTLTWDGTTISGYFDGAAFAGNQTPQGSFSTFDIGQYLAVGAFKHNSVANTTTGNCVIQYGEALAIYMAQLGYPQNQQYVYPNAGFLNGKIDDVRIYNKALTSSEVQSLYSNSLNQPANPSVPAQAPVDADGDGVANGMDLCPSTPAGFSGQVNRYGCIKPNIAGFDIKPDVDQDIREITNLRFGKSLIGQVRFMEKVALIRDNQAIDVTANLVIEKNKITLNSSALSELNKRAELQFEGVKFANPQIIKDGIACVAPQCLVRAFANGVLVVEVQGFSSYEVAEGTTTAVIIPYPIASTVVSLSGGGSGTGSSSGGGYAGSQTATLGAILNPTIYGNGLSSAAQPVSCSAGQVFNIATGQRCTTSVGMPESEETSLSSYAFTRNLTIGMRGEDVRRLQRVLNAKGFRVAASGIGSSGMESTTFGPGTRRALASYQLSKGIKPAAGYFGPATRASIGGDGVSVAKASVSAASILKLGSAGSEVKVLRRKLRALGYLAPYGSAAGVPASGAAETGLFGATTEAALKKYQCDKGIVCSGSAAATGWGSLGLATRAMLGL